MPRDKTKRKNREGKEREFVPSGANAAPLNEECYKEVEEDTQANARWLNQANFGKLPDEQLLYLQNMEHVLNAKEEESDRALFLQGFFREMNGKELPIAGDMHGSRILERVLCVANGTLVRLFWQRLSERYASHVLQTLLSLSPKYLEEERIETENGTVPSIADLLEDFISHVAPYWLDLLSDTFASHSIRLLIQLSNGNWEGDELTRSKKSKSYHEGLKGDQSQRQGPNSWLIPKSITEGIQNLLDTILSEKTKKTRKLALDPTASPLLTLLLNKSDKLITVITAGDLNPHKRLEWLQFALCDPVGSHLLQSLFSSAPQSALSHLISLLSPHFQFLLSHKIANFPAQSLLQRLDRKELDTILQNFDIQTDTITGVCISMATACVRTSSNYANLTNKIWKYLQCEIGKVEDIPFLLPSILAMERTQSLSIATPGCLLASQIVKFPTVFSRPIVLSLLSLDVSQFLLHPQGSRLIQAILESETTSPHDIRSLGDIMIPMSKELAVNSCASHCLESLFAIANVQKRDAICALLSNCHKLPTVPCGRKVAIKFGLSDYKTKWKFWREKYGVRDRSQKGMAWLQSNLATKKEEKENQFFYEDVQPEETRKKRHRSTKI